jgi:hypothetical protein
LFFRNDVRSLNPIPFAPISPTLNLSLAGTPGFPIENASKGKTLPAATADAVLINVLLSDFMMICS